MTEKLPHLPQAYQPPSTVPDDGYEPPLVEPYRPPDSTPGRRGPALLVVALGLLLCPGLALIAVQFWPGAGTAPASGEAVTAPRAATPRAESTPSPAAPTLAELVALPGSAEQGRWDSRDGALTSIHLVNDSPGRVTVNWLDHDRKRVLYQTLDPAQSYDQQTYAGHVWVIAGADGKAIAVFRATDVRGLAVIR